METFKSVITQKVYKMKIDKNYQRKVNAGVRLARIIQEGIDIDDLEDSRLKRR